MMPDEVREADKRKPSSNDIVDESRIAWCKFLLQSYDFDNCNFLYLYSHFPELQKAIDSGKYVFVNGKVVLKSRDCLRIENGRLSTIVFSNDELPEYCLSRIITIPGTGTNNRQSNFKHETPVEEARKVSSLKDVTSRVFNIPHILIRKIQHPIRDLFNNGTSKFQRETRVEEARRISSLKDIRNDNLYVMIGGGQDPPNDFCRALIHFMSSRDITIEQLAEETGLSEKTIQRMRNDSDRAPAIESVVAVCVGLHLDAYDSDMLLYLAGYTLRNRRIHRIYRLFLNFAYKEDVKDCNEMLIRLGEKPLTDLHE